MVLLAGVGAVVVVRAVPSGPFRWIVVALVSLATASTYNRVEGLPVLIGPRLRLTRPWGALTVEALSGVADLRVALEVDTAFGATWFDAQKH
jgi:hypothetical protein